MDGEILQPAQEILQQRVVGDEMRDQRGIVAGRGRRVRRGAGVVAGGAFFGGAVVEREHRFDLAGVGRRWNCMDVIPIVDRGGVAARSLR